LSKEKTYVDVVAFFTLPALTIPSYFLPGKGLESIYGGLYDGQVFTEYGWDPWGIGKKATKDQLLMYRESELTHGRVAMLAALGILTVFKYFKTVRPIDGFAYLRRLSAGTRSLILRMVLLYNRLLTLPRSTLLSGSPLGLL